MSEKITGFILTFILAFSPVYAVEWQWSVPLKDVISSETNDHPEAFLWIPSGCKKVKAVVFGQHNMLEEGILEHPFFRKRMSQLGVASIWVSPGFDQVWNPEKKSQEIFNSMMDSFAVISGYNELKYAPVIPLGHSAMATFPWNFAAQNNERTLAILSVHGDAPATQLTGYGRANLDWTNLKIDGIPGLMVIGEYEWWNARVQPGLDYKKRNPDACVSFLCDAGRGHFDYSEQLIDYLCLFIEKAVKYRLPKQMNRNQPVELIPVNPEKGWLADRWHIDSVPDARAAAFQNYKGKGDNAFWYFDRQMAQKTEKIYNQQLGKQKQYLCYTSENQILSFNPKHFYGYLPLFVPDSDGVTFHISTDFTDSSRLKLTTNHSRTKSVITRICGPVQKLNDSTFRVQFYRMGLNNSKRTGDICLMISNDGDKNFKSAVQQSLIKIPYPLKEGKEQFITFDSIPDIKAGTKSVDLHAKSTSGLQVYFYVKNGPAEVKGNKLVLTKIPVKSKYPVKVTVFAWQYGKASAEKYKTAQTIKREFFIVK